MEFLSPLFELEQIDEIFPFSPFPLQELTCLQDPPVPTLDNKKDVYKPNRKRKSSQGLLEKDKSNSKNVNADEVKKIIHRDVERQRRQEMAALNRSLKSLLPPETLKGKRSLCDHINETVSYIRHMRNKVEEQSKKRDELKRPLNKLTMHVGSKYLSNNKNETKPDEEISSRANVQIILSTSLNADVALSRLLDLLIQEGLDVISCTSTYLNERLVHTIETEVSEGRSINPYEVQEKLRYLVA